MSYPEHGFICWQSQRSAAQIKNLAEALTLFDLPPGARTPEDYSKYMIQQSAISTHKQISTLL